MLYLIRAVTRCNTSSTKHSSGKISARGSTEWSRQLRVILLLHTGMKEILTVVALNHWLFNFIFVFFISMFSFQSYGCCSSRLINLYHVTVWSHNKIECQDLKTVVGKHRGTMDRRICILALFEPILLNSRALRNATRGATARVVGPRSGNGRPRGVFPREAISKMCNRPPFVLATTLRRPR